MLFKIQAQAARQQLSNSNHIHQQLSKAQQLKAARQPRQQGSSPSSPEGLMPPAAMAGCCKSDHLSSYRGHRFPPQAATGRQGSAPPLQQPGQDPTNLTTWDFRLPDPEPPSSPTKHSTQRSAAEAAAFKYICIYTHF